MPSLSHAPSQTEPSQEDHLKCFRLAWRQGPAPSLFRAFDALSRGIECLVKSILTTATARHTDVVADPRRSKSIVVVSAG